MPVPDAAVDRVRRSADPLWIPQARVFVGALPAKTGDDAADAPQRARTAERAYVAVGRVQDAAHVRGRQTPGKLVDQRLLRRPRAGVAQGERRRIEPPKSGICA